MSTNIISGPAASSAVRDGPVDTSVQVEEEMANPPVSTLWQKVHFLACCAGIFVFYFYYGVIQENITKSKYGSDKESFVYTQALVFMQCIVNSGFSYIALMFQSREQDTTTKRLYASCAFTYVGAMVTSNKALQWVAYPTQVLGKSVKPIPVMILGVLIAEKVYPRAKYLFVLLIVAGVALFMYKDKTADVNQTTSVFGMGEFLLVASLAMDGLTGATQDRMRGDHQTKPYHMMLNMNLWSLLYISLGLTATGEGLRFLEFVRKFPEVLWSMLQFSLCSAVGQNFIFLTVSHYGPLVCSIVTTTRKFFTILGSILLFGHPVLNRQWAGTLLVFIGLGLDSAYGKEIKKDKRATKAAVS